MQASNPIRGLLMLVLVLAGPIAAHGQAGPALEQARAAVAEFREYQKHKNPRVRELAVATLAGTDHLQVTEALLRMVKDKAPKVRQAAVLGLEKQRSKEGIAHLVKIMWRGGDKAQRLAVLRAFRKVTPKLAYGPAQDLTRAGDWELRAAAVELVGCYPDQEGAGLGTLLSLFNDKEPMVRLAVVDAARKLGNPEASRRVATLLRDKDWRIQAAAIKALVVFRQKGSVQPLIDLMKRAKGRLVEDAGSALVALTGTNLPAEAERWQKWWDKVKDGYRILTAEELRKRKKKREMGGYAKPKPDPRRYHGIKTRSRRMLFVVDISSSMADDIVLDESRGQAAEEFRKRYGDSLNKIEITRNELIRMVYELKPYVRFNIVTFNSNVQRWQKKLVPANQGNRYKAIKFLDKLTPRALQAAGSRMGGGGTAGQTNSYAALNTCFEITKEDDQQKKRYKTQADTVFFLSDGNPTVGEIVNPQELLDHARRMNKKARLVIHTISFGADNKAFMRELAKMSGGQYINIVP